MSETPYEDYEKEQDILNDAERMARTSHQVLDALFEAYYMYDFPVNVIFNGRPLVIELLKKSILARKGLLGITHSLKRRNMLYLELTGIDLLKLIKDEAEMEDYKNGNKYNN